MDRFEVPNGLGLLVEELKVKFPYDEVLHRSTTVGDFESCERKRDEGLQHYVKAFDQRYQRMRREGITLPDDYVVQRMLRNAHLFPRDRAAILAAAGKRMEWRAIIKAMVFVYPGGKAPWCESKDGRVEEGRSEKSLPPKGGHRGSPKGAGKGFRRAYATELDRGEDFDEEDPLDLDGAEAVEEGMEDDLDCFGLEPEDVTDEALQAQHEVLTVAKPKLAKMVQARGYFKKPESSSSSSATASQFRLLRVRSNARKRSPS